MIKYILSLLLIPSILFGANIYVDQTLGSNITNGSYSVANRNNTGSDGNAYTTIQAAIAASSVGDKIYMRGGEYDCSTSGEDEISIAGKDGTSWEEGNYFYLASYPGEWAILDGKRSTTNGVVLHGGFPCYGSDVNSHYWKFERFEVKGGGRASTESTCSGIWLNVGPFVFRYLYIHDNISYSTGDNPAGLSMTEAVNSTIEYCFFNNNGSDTQDTHNAAQIIFYGEVNDVAATGKNGYATSRGGSINNIVRYCYFTSGIYGVGIKNKIAVFYSGRNPDGGYGWEDAYSNYGLKIHHNILSGLNRTAIMMDSDFAQVYNNIISSCGSPNISVSYSPGINMNQFYKACIYNNTMVGVPSSAITRYGRDNLGERYCPTWQPDRTHYGWDLNNLITEGQGVSPWGEEEIINVTPYATGVSSFDLSNYVGSNNYFYNNNSADVYRLYNVSYTPAEYAGQSVTHAPRVVYNTSSDSPFLGETGADQYIASGSFVLTGSTTISNGGIGGSHPYLSGVTIPSYIGAVNPSDSDWVAGVLAMDATYFTGVTAGSDPTWIEGSGSSPSTPTIRSGGIRSGGFR